MSRGEAASESETKNQPQCDFSRCGWFLLAMSVHQHHLLSIQAGQDFLDLFLHFLVFFFQGIDPFILSCIVGFDSRDFCSLVMDGLCHFGLADAVVCRTLANLEGDAGIEARVAVTKGNAGSPYAIVDYYDIDPDLADNEANRMEEFEKTVSKLGPLNLE